MATSRADAEVAGLRGLGSWLLFDFRITMPFVSGVSLVIASIFLYGSKPEQVASWVDAVKGAIGMRGKEDYNLVAQMEPILEAEAGGSDAVDAEDAELGNGASERLEPPTQPAPMPPKGR